MSRKHESSILVTKDECKQVRDDCQDANAKVSLALFGQDGRGGIVKDVQDIKTKLDSLTSVFRQLGAPVIVAVVVALIVRFLP